MASASVACNLTAAEQLLLTNCESNLKTNLISSKYCSEEMNYVLIDIQLFMKFSESFVHWKMASSGDLRSLLGPAIFSSIPGNAQVIITGLYQDYLSKYWITFHF